MGPFRKGLEMSEYNLTIFDLEEGKKYWRKHCNSHSYYILSGIGYASDRHEISSKCELSTYMKFKEIKPEPELVELKLYKTKLGLMFTSSHVIPQSLVPYQIKDGKIYVEK